MNGDGNWYCSYIQIIMMQHNHYPQDDLALMEANLLQLQREITERSQESQDLQEEMSSSHLRKRSSRQDGELQRDATTRNTLTVIQTKYEQYLRESKLPENHEEKINMLLEERACLGNSIALFEMLYYFKEALAEEVLEEIAGKYFEAMLGTEKEEEMACYCELLAQCGVESQDICQHIAELMVEEKIDFQLGFLVLSNQGETGLIYLFDIANRDIPNLSNKILDYLGRTETIITELIVPLLLEDLTSTNHSKYKDIALSILNRLGPIITNPKIINSLIDLLSDPTIDKKILLATIRSLGLDGEKVLLDVITSRVYSENIVSLALSVLSWRVPSKIAMRVKTIEFTIENCFLPGRLYQYQGQVQPWNFTSDNSTDSLCLSSRDFIAQLEIFIKEGVFKKPKTVNNKHLFKLVEVLALDEEENVQISEEVVRVLTHQLKNKSIKVREIALIELGNIGKPEAASATDAVAKCLYDQDSSIRSAACWTISRICIEPTRKIQARLSQLVRDHFWKVRTSACMALGLILRSPQNSTVQSLLKTLQDGSIPKPTVCETLVRMGAEELLLQILKGSNKNDFKLREAIISSFEFSSLRSPLINVIVEELLRYSRDARIETRELCLLILNSLRQKVQAKGGESISYFQTKNLLPFYYCFLDDTSQKIRSIAAQSILSFGSQSQLIFIEGMTKGQPLAKIECIRCLGKLGVQNFRALVLGLRDDDQRVKRAACSTILGNFTSQDIIEQFKGRENHSISLLCNLTEILKGPIKNQELRQFLQEVILGLQDVRKKGVIRHYNENIRYNN